MGSHPDGYDVLDAGAMNLLGADEMSRMTFAAVLAIVAWMAAEAQAQSCVRFGRTVQCQPIVSAYTPAVADQVIVPAYQASAAPIIIQNNYPPIGIGVGTTQYGYAQPQAPYATQPQVFAPDPTAILREAARLTERAQDLAGDGLGAYERLSAVALTQATLQQGMALSAPQARTEAQASPYTAGKRQTICITPDGAGGFTIRMVDEPAESGPARPTGAAGDPAIGPSDQTGSGPTGSLEQRFATILNRSCISCHSGDAPKGEFTLVDRSGNLAALSDAQVATLIDEVQSGRMPQGADPLSDDEVAVIRSYFALSRAGGDR